jgi:hypothetical protein
MCADVGSLRHEVELIRASTRQGPVRPPQGEPQAGERRRWEDIGVRHVDGKRASKRNHYDEPGAGPSHVPLATAGGEFEDFHRRLELVLQGMPEGMWVHIQDEGILEQCIGLPAKSRMLIHREAIAGAAMTGRFPPGPEGWITGGVTPLEGGPGGGALEVP